MKKQQLGSWLMLEYQCGTKILLGRMVAQTTDCTGQGGENRRIGRGEEIDAQVDRPTLMVIDGEHVSQVNRRRFVVAPDADFVAKLPPQWLGVSRRVGEIRNPRQ